MSAMFNCMCVHDLVHPHIHTLPGAYGLAYFFTRSHKIAHAHTCSIEMIILHTSNMGYLENDGGGEPESESSHGGAAVGALSLLLQMIQTCQRKEVD